MTLTIELASGGSAEFNQEYIRIDDKKERRNDWIFLASSLLWVPTSILFLAADDFQITGLINWMWLFVLVAHLIVGPLRIWTTSFQSMIWLDEVKSAKVMTGYQNATLSLKLRNGKRRNIRAKYDHAKTFRTFVAANFS